MPVQGMTLKFTPVPQEQMCCICVQPEAEMAVQGLSRSARE